MNEYPSADAEAVTGAVKDAFATPEAVAAINGGVLRVAKIGMSLPFSWEALHGPGVTASPWVSLGCSGSAGFGIVGYTPFMWPWSGRFIGRATSGAQVGTILSQPSFCRFRRRQGG